MSWKSWIPYKGNTTVRRKLRELDEAGVGIPMIIILLFTKGVELIIKGLGNEIPLPLWATFFLAGFLVLAVYVYDKQLKRKASKAKDKAEEKVDDSTN